MPVTLHVVSHTHWDREWYLPFEVFRLKLVQLIDHLLDILDNDPSFCHFSLDAQTIVLEDYLAIRPGARDRLRQAIQTGRVGIGPWYQLNDEFLVSAEATIRSLLVGTRIAREFGGGMAVGYLPDQFGHISQMPQILRGFGIDNAILGRGRQLFGDRKMEFWWEAPDGSRVLSSLMAYWYNNAQYIPDEPSSAVEFLRNLRDTMSARSAASHLLLMNGVDHLEPQPWIGGVLQQASEQMQDGSGDTLLHSSLAAYVDALRTEVAERSPDLKTVRGELREDRGGSCLAGTLSTRVYLKQANDAVQNALERFAEPLSAFAMIQGASYPSDELRYAWKLLMQNHPHDSICGCSVDAVHEEMMIRFQRVKQVADVCVERALDVLARRDRTQGAVALPCNLYVVNTLNWERSDPLRAIVDIPLGPPTRGNAQRSQEALLHGLRILSPSGDEVPYEVTANETLIAMVTNPLDLPKDQWVQRVTIQFVAQNVPACGYAVYRIEPASEWYKHGPEWRGHTSNCWELTLEDGGDAGDEYLYRAPLGDRFVCLSFPAGTDRTEQTSAVRRTEFFSAALELPTSSSPSGRSEHLVRCPVTLERTVWNGVPRAEMRLVFENNATDHRLRAVFRADPHARVAAGGQFDVLERPLRPREEEEGASPFYPMTLWVDAGGGPCDRGFTVIAPGIHEYECYVGADGDLEGLALTLLRCVGQLSGRGDGPGITTPGAQCPGKHTFELAVFNHEGDWETGHVWKQALQFACPLIAVQGPVRGEERIKTFVSLSPETLVLSALKRAEDRDTVILRFYNTTTQSVSGVVAELAGAVAWRRVNLNEEPAGEWQGGPRAVLAVRSKEIVTLEYRL